MRYPNVPLQNDYRCFLCCLLLNKINEFTITFMYRRLCKICSNSFPTRYGLKTPKYSILYNLTVYMATTLFVVCRSGARHSMRMVEGVKPNQSKLLLMPMPNRLEKMLSTVLLSKLQLLIISTLLNKQLSLLVFMVYLQ